MCPRACWIKTIRLDLPSPFLFLCSLDSVLLPLLTRVATCARSLNLSPTTLFNNHARLLLAPPLLTVPVLPLLRTRCWSTCLRLP
jgi:hypothetical protein